MNISVQRLLGKMEDELKQAKLSNHEAHVRERIHVVKALCELVLEAKPEQPSIKMATSPTVTSQPLPSDSQTQKIKLDEISNSDSLFDF